jgi:hypothetical protein
MRNAQDIHLQKKMYIFCLFSFFFYRCPVGCCIDENWMVRLQAETNMTEVSNDKVTWKEVP